MLLLRMMTLMIMRGQNSAGFRSTSTWTTKEKWAPAPQTHVSIEPYLCNPQERHPKSATLIASKAGLTTSKRCPVQQNAGLLQNDTRQFSKLKRCDKRGHPNGCRHWSSGTMREQGKFCEPMQTFGCAAQKLIRAERTPSLALRRCQKNRCRKPRSSHRARGSIGVHAYYRCCCEWYSAISATTIITQCCCQ